jgi:hypothetical protein
MPPGLMIRSLFRCQPLPDGLSGSMENNSGVQDNGPNRPHSGVT